jgi:hypothetical protein
VNILKESYAIDTSESGFVHVTYTQLVDNGVDMGGQMWFERANLRWVVDALKACVQTYGAAKTSTQAGQDSLSVAESGHEQQPFVNLRNRRPVDAPHPGAFTVALTKPLAAQFVAELDKL